VSQSSSLKPVTINGVKCCPMCGCSYLRRVPRVGFKQKVILSAFGYYPWECGQCKESFILRKRYGRRRVSDPEYRD
jgi:hypothetical protein